MVFESEEVMNAFYNLQGTFKRILGVIILSNFVLIFALQMQIKLTNKFKSMFNLTDIKEESIAKIKSVLIITAHPDDEIMFLSPTIKKLKSLNIKIKILCLSIGDYDGLGKLRIEEFKEVSKNLHMEDNKIIDHPQLKDNITTLWDYKIVAEQIKAFLDENKDIGSIITFDENGVTKHPNHVSTYYGLETYIKENRQEFKERGINVYLFDSFNPLTQYTFNIPFIYMYFKEFGYFDWNPMFSWKYMTMYKTQFNLARKIHVLLSGYTYCNSFTKVEIQ